MGLVSKVYLEFRHVQALSWHSGFLVFGGFVGDVGLGFWV